MDKKAIKELIKNKNIVSFDDCVSPGIVRHDNMLIRNYDFEADYMPYSEYHDVVGDRFQGQDRRGGDRGDYSEYHYQAPRDDSALYYRGRSKRTGRYVSR